jgi:hypothetical protein
MKGVGKRAVTVIITCSALPILVAPALAGSPQNQFTWALANAPFDGWDGNYVNPEPGISTGQTDSPTSQVTNPVTALYYDSGGLNTVGGNLVSTGISSAFSDRPLRQLHAEAGANSITDYFPQAGFGAGAQALFGDTLTFTGGSSGTTTVGFSVHIDGNLTSFFGSNTATGQPSASLLARFGQNTDGFCPEGGFCPTLSPNVDGGEISEQWNLANSDIDSLTVDETFTGSFSFTGASASVPVLYQLAVGGQYGKADFSETATLTLDPLPAGISYTTASGYSLSAVPETSTWTAMLVGFAGLGWVARQQSKRKIARQTS